MRSLYSAILKLLAAPQVAGAIAVLALFTSAVSLFYTRQSDLRQLEQLIVTEGDQFSIADDPSLEVSKGFEVANISDRVVSVQELHLEVRPAISSGRPSGRTAIEVDGSELARKENLNLVIKPGESIKVVAKIVPGKGLEATKFLNEIRTGTTVERLTALCRQAGIDIYDNALNRTQRDNCPSFRTYKGKHNLQFNFGGTIRGEVLMLVIRTHRDNIFSSDRYQLEIGNSVL